MEYCPGKMGTAKTQILQERWGAGGRTVVRPPAPKREADGREGAISGR